tara:strand:+ start:269 stop:892 length:624 start_codon:yes stop_codon:yes gene_type:complete
MLRKIKLYGELAEFVGHKEFEIQVDTLQKAVSFLIYNFAGIEKYMNPRYYQVKVGDYAVDESEICHPIGQEDIHFVPVISGAGRGFGKILLGAALIAGAFFMPVASGNVSLYKGLFGAAGSFAKVGFMTKAMAGVGLMLTMSGVSEMLFPLPTVPDFEDTQDPRLSFSFGGTQQTGRAGTPVPLVFGEIFTGSVVISGSVDTEQVQA